MPFYPLPTTELTIADLTSDAFSQKLESLTEQQRQTGIALVSST